MPKHKRSNDIFIKDNVIYNTRKKTKCIFHLEKDSMTGEDLIICQVLHDMNMSKLTKANINSIANLLVNMEINDNKMEIDTKPREWFKD